MKLSSERRGTVIAAAAVLLLLGIPTARWLYRYQFSCIWAMRDYTHFSLQGRIQKMSCSLPLFATERIVYVLDSATAATTDREARAQPRYHRIEGLSADSTHALGRLEAINGRHGWYYSTVGQDLSGGYTLIVFDTDARTLSVEHAPF